MAGRRLLRVGVDFEARFAGFEQGVRRVDKNVRQLNTRMGKAFSATTKTVEFMRRSVIGLGAAFGAVRLARFVGNTLKAADEIGKLSTRLGISTEALSEYQVIAELTGVSFQTLTLGLQRAVRRISEAAVGTGEAQKALKELNLDVKELNQLAPDKQFEALADAILKVKNPADQLRLSVKLFDSEAAAFLQTIKGLGGSEGIEGLRERLRDLGVSLDQDAADAAANARDAMTLLGAQWGVLGRNIAIFLGGPAVDFLKWLNDVTEGVLKAGREVAEFLGASTTLARDIEKQIEATEQTIRNLEEELSDPSKIKEWFSSWGGENFQAQLRERLQESREKLFELNLMLFQTREAGAEAKTGIDEVANSAEEFTKEIEEAAKATEKLRRAAAFTQAQMDSWKPTWEELNAIEDRNRRITEEVIGTYGELFALDGPKKLEEQYINVTETIQNRLQPVVAEFYEDLFGGRALKSVEDFLNSVKDMFIRIFAEIAAKITINKLFGGLLGGLGISIGGSAAGGAGAALGLGGIGAALKGGASKIGGALGFGAAAGGATAFALPAGGVGTGGLIAGTPLSGIGGAFTSSGAGGGAAAPGLGGLGSFAGPLAAVGVGLAISRFGARRSPEEIWSNMWDKKIIPLIESGAAEAAQIIDTTLWDKVDQDGIEATQTLGRQWLFVQDRVQEFATAIETIVPGAYAKVMENGGVLVKTTTDQQRQLVEDVVAAWQGKLEPGVLSTLAKIDLSSQRVVDAMADGFVYASESAALGIENLGNVSSDVFAAMIRAAGSVAGEIGGIVGRAEDARAAVRAIPGATSVPALPGFQSGGSFTVGGQPGPDQNVVAFRATQGEQVTVTPRGGGDTNKLLRQILAQITQQRLDLSRLAVAH